MHEKDKRDNGTARKVLVVTSGAYEDYREAHFYVPANFSWAQVAEEVAARSDVSMLRERVGWMERT